VSESQRAAARHPATEVRIAGMSVGVPTRRRTPPRDRGVDCRCYCQSPNAPRHATLRTTCALPVLVSESPSASARYPANGGCLAGRGVGVPSSALAVPCNRRVHRRQLPEGRKMTQLSRVKSPCGLSVWQAGGHSKQNSLESWVTNLLWSKTGFSYIHGGADNPSISRPHNH
jgi:hypothetical protein